MNRSAAEGAEKAIAGLRRLAGGILLLLLLILAGCATITPKPADIRQDGRATLPNDTASGKQLHREDAGGGVAELVELLRNKNLISAEEAGRIINRYKGSADGVKTAAVLTPPAATGAGEAVKIPASLADSLRKDLQEQIKIQVREEVPKEVKKLDLAAAVPEWMKRIRFGGDIRLRYESDRFDKKNADLAKPDAPTQLMNTKIDQDRFKYRVRVGAEVPVNDKVEAVVRLGTGNDSNPIATNSTMGDYMNRDRVYFDLAYLRWRPASILTFEGGRIPNPWFHTDLVWSPNLNLEGFALHVKKEATDLPKPFLTLGAFPLQQYDFSQRGKWLTAGQLGLEMKRKKGISAKIGAAYYNFSNMTGEANDPLNPGLTDWTAPLYQQKGNTLFDIGTGGVVKTALASEFKLFNVTGMLDIGFWDPVHIVLVGDYVKNFGFNRADVARRTGVANPEEWTDGYQVGIAVGYPVVREFGQWKAYLYYKYLGADAVVDAFTDADFHLGGTNARGWILGTDFGLSKNFWFSARWLTANEISGPALAIDVLQLDLNARF